MLAAVGAPALRVAMAGMTRAVVPGIARQCRLLQRQQIRKQRLRLAVGTTTPCAGAYAFGSGTGVVPGGTWSTTLNIQSNAGMIDSGTTARGL